MEDDLTDQLYRLEANDCHFYQRQFFANSDYYEEWRSLELERLTKLINKWCPDFKHIKAYKINVFDAHSAFTILADKFLKYVTLVLSKHFPMFLYHRIRIAL